MSLFVEEEDPQVSEPMESMQSARRHRDETGFHSDLTDIFNF